MAETVKRSYQSPLRVDQARQTRRRVVTAAIRLFVGQGYGQTTIEAIGAAAGVSRKTVFGVGSKLQLLSLALDWATTGDDEDAPLSQRAQITALAAENDPDVLVTAWAGITADISARLSGLSAALSVAAGLDPEAQALREQAHTQRLSGSRAFVRHLAKHGRLRAGLTLETAADLVWLFSDPTWHHRLVTQRGWSAPHFRSWLEATIHDQLLEHQ